ncbi:Uncharacterised protein [Vibrio cholerae]|nr:Uncharacterised protein [Vibrio cholerae]
MRLGLLESVTQLNSHALRQWQGSETKKAARRQLWYCWKIYRKLVGNSTVVDEEMNLGK